MYNAYQTTDFKIFLTKQNHSLNVMLHRSYLLWVVAREDNESGNDDWKGESSETSTHDADDEGDSYNRQVKEFQKRAISRFPVRCRTISDAQWRSKDDQAKPFQRGFTKMAPVFKKYVLRPLKNKQSNTNRE